MAKGPKTYQTVSQPVEVFQYIEGEEEEILTWLRDLGANVSDRIGFIQYGIGYGWVSVHPDQYIIRPESGQLYVLGTLEGRIEEAPAKPKTVSAPRRKPPVRAKKEDV